jgi:hypothetical protein
MKAKRPANPMTSDRLALGFVGLRDGSRLSILGAHSRGFNSLQVHTVNSPADGANHWQGTSSGRSRKDGVSTPAVIFAPGSEESKEENDVPQLPDRMQKVRKDSRRPATVSLLPVLQDLFRATKRVPGWHVHCARESGRRYQSAPLRVALFARFKGSLVLTRTRL